MQKPGFLTARQNPVWAVVTGNVRSGREFRGIFGKILALRERGLVDGIRFVTWESELEAAPRLENVLAGLGISVLTVKPPAADPRTHPLFHGYVYHQRKSLHFALRSLPADAFVLKARTDLAEDRFDAMVAALFENESLQLEPSIPEPLLETRLFTYDARPDYLFYWDDIVFSGMRDDLLKLNNFDVACDIVHADPDFPAECRLFAPLFGRRYPLLRWFFENIDGKEFGRLLHLRVAGGNDTPLPALIRHIFASYFHILSRYVLLPNGGEAFNGGIGLHDFLTPGDDRGVKAFPHPWPSHKLCNAALLDRLRGNETFADPELGAIAALMRDMDSNVASRGALPPDIGAEAKTLADFAARFGCRPLKPQTRLIPAISGSTGHDVSELRDIPLPEKRHLTWWQGKVTGFRRNAAGYVIRKLL